MKPRHKPSLFLAALAVCDVMRHTGASEVDPNLSLQMSGPKVEMIPDLLQKAKEMEMQKSNQIIKVFFEKDDWPSCNWMPIKTKIPARERFIKITPNTAPLKHYKNPRRFRCG